MRGITWGKRALAELGGIERRDRSQAVRISDAVARYAAADLGDVVKMAGGSGIYRLRVGDWRVLFTLSDGGRSMAVSRILNRRDAYR